MNKRSRLIVAGTGSGSGKTTVTLGLMRAFAQMGLNVQGFKCGPDYIDPTYHSAVTGRPAYNLDSWMTSSSYLVNSFLRHSQEADLSVIEGVMGLYDGKEAAGLAGSTAEIAILTNSPVLLVVDVSSMGRSAAAIVLGFQQLEQEIHIAAVIVNRCGSASHYEMVKQAIETACKIPVIGWLKRDAELNIPERHLGLLPAVERGELEPLFEHAAALLSEGTDLSRLLNIARFAPSIMPPHDTGLQGEQFTRHGTGNKTDETSGAIESPVIAVARDAAFNFYYPDNLEFLTHAGARIVEFSPLSGDGVPGEADGIYLGGGFPEEFAAAIASNSTFMNGLRLASGNGMPIYAECGGYMVLSRTLTDRSGTTHNMAGLIPAHTVMQQQRAALGYREVTALEDCLLLKKGEQLRGHEFHYSVMHYDNDTEPKCHAYESRGRGVSSLEGFIKGHLMAAYTHIHLASHYSAAIRWVEACRSYRASKVT